MDLALENLIYDVGYTKTPIKMGKQAVPKIDKIRNVTEFIDQFKNFSKNNGLK